MEKILSDIILIEVIINGEYGIRRSLLWNSVVNDLLNSFYTCNSLTRMIIAQVIVKY